MSNLAGMFQQLNNTIKETPLAAKGPGTPAGMPYNPMDNINPMMQQMAQGMGNMAGGDPEANMTSGQKMTMSNENAAAAMQSEDPEMLRQAASLMMKQGRTQEAQQLIQRADQIKKTKIDAGMAMLDEGAADIEMGVAKAKDAQSKEKAKQVASSNGHDKWVKMLASGNVSAEKYYTWLADQEGKIADDKREFEAERQLEALKETGVGTAWTDGQNKLYSEMLVEDTELTGSINKAQTALDTLAKAKEDSDYGANGGFWDGGKAGSGIAYLKKQLGSEDAYITFKQQFLGVRNLELMNSLPPGPASDPDVQLAKQGFPGDDATVDQMEAFLRGSKKIAEALQERKQFEMNYFSTHGGSMSGLAKAWRSETTGSTPFGDLP